MHTSIRLTLLLAIFSTSFLGISKEVEIRDYWQILSIEKDNSIKKRHSKVKVIVVDQNSNLPLKGVKVFIDSVFLLGQTDSMGTLSGLMASGENRFCADTKQGNSFTTNYNFLSQHSYVIKITMYPAKFVPRVDGEFYPVALKPVIYLYPTTKQKINVRVIPTKKLLFTYPIYPKNGWNVIAQPSGKIDYKNKTYNYLFWEGTYPPIVEQEEKTGFIINSDTLVQFLENTLTKIGLTTEEQTDFITYWGPKLTTNKLNFIHFYFNDDCEKHIAKLKNHT